MMHGVDHATWGPIRDLSELGRHTRMNVRHIIAVTMRLIPTFPHPVCNFCHETEFTIENNAISLHYAYNPIHKPLKSFRRPSRNHLKRFVEFMLSWSQPLNQSPKFIEPFKPRKFVNNAFLFQKLGLRLCEHHNSVDFFRMQKAIHPCGGGKNNNCGFQLASKKRVWRCSCARHSLGNLFRLPIDFISEIARNDVFKERCGFFNNAIVINQTFDSIQPECAMGLPFVTNRADIIVGAAFFQPASRDPSPTEISSGIAIVYHKKHWLKIEPDMCFGVFYGIFLSGFCEFVLFVLVRIYAHKEVRGFENPDFDGVSFCRRLAFEPRKKSHELTPEAFSKGVSSGYFSLRARQAQ